MRQQVEARFAMPGAVEAQHKIVGARFVAGGDGDAGRQGRGDAAQIEAGPGRDDKVARYEQIRGVVPLADAEKRIGAHQAKERVVGAN